MAAKPQTPSLFLRWCLALLCCTFALWPLPAYRPIPLLNTGVYKRREKEKAAQGPPRMPPCDRNLGRVRQCPQLDGRSEGVLRYAARLLLRQGRQVLAFVLRRPEGVFLPGEIRGGRQPRSTRKLCGKGQGKGLPLDSGNPGAATTKGAQRVEFASGGSVFKGKAHERGDWRGNLILSARRLRDWAPGSETGFQALAPSSRETTRKGLHPSKPQGKKQADLTVNTTR